MSSKIIIPESVRALCETNIGDFFREVRPGATITTVSDFLDEDKSHIHATNIQKFIQLRERKFLEIGSGYGVNLAVFIKTYGVDGFGVEPESPDFRGGVGASKELFRINGMDPNRIVTAFGENLPFDDETFDIVYSCNVLEHTKDPEQVLREAIRVLRPHGILHMEYPNHLSYLEGHYLILQPPLFARWVLPFVLRVFYRRNNEYAKTLQTQINPIWTKKAIERIAEEFPVDLISQGEEFFLERMRSSVEFEARQVELEIGSKVRIIQRFNYGNWIGKLIVRLKGHFPIYLTVRKK